MLIVRNEQFFKYGNDLYIAGSSSNELYINNMAQMGHIEILGWTTPVDDCTGLTPLLKDHRIKVIENPNNLSIIQKIKCIKQAVTQADCLSIKFCFVDSFIACQLARWLKKPYVIESGTDAFKSSWSHGGSIKYKLLALPYELMTRYYHATAKHIIYVSKHFLQKKYPSRANQLGCPDVVLSEVGIDILEKRLEKIDNSHIFNLGLIGSTTVGFRGHDTLIKVAAELIKKGYHIKVRFLGNDKGKDRLNILADKEGIASVVIYDGYKNRQGVFDWIDSIDILVMPTTQETLGRAIIESMSRACPVIGSSETAIPEQIGSDCIANAKDVTGIVKIIERMINNRDYMKLCAIENFFRSKKYCSSFTNIQKRSFYENFYKSNNIKMKWE